MDEIRIISQALSTGSGAPVQAFAEQIQAMMNANGVHRCGVCVDDARGLQGETVVGMLREAGLSAYRPHAKSRVGGWQRINEMLDHAKTGKGSPLYITDRCPHLIQTMAEMPRGKPPMRADDSAPDYTSDHHCDAARYGLVDILGNRVRCGTTIGGCS